MTTTVCPRCGASLESSARFCAGCGQPLQAGPAGGGPGAAPPRKVPVVPIAIFGGGAIVALVGAFLYMRSPASPAGGPSLVPSPAAATVSTAPPASPAPVDPASPATVPPLDPAASPGAPGSSSVFQLPDQVPPATGSASPAGPGPAAAGPAGNRAPSTKVWRDPLAPSPGGSAPPPAQAQPQAQSSSRRVSPPPPPPQSRVEASSPARPAPPVQPPVAHVFDCRENAVFNISPEDIVITVDGQSIGTADRWDGTNDRKKYHFRGPGTHFVKLSREGYETVWLKFEVTETSIYRTADVEIQMRRSGR